jgi:hypothetical protein
MSRDPMTPFDDNEFSKPDTAATDLKDRASNIASRTRDKASDVADTVSEKLGHTRGSAAEGLNRAASTIRDTGGRFSGASQLRNVTEGLANGMESTATYLRDHDFNQMGKDVMNLCRRYPTQSLIAALAVGFLIGRSRR